LGLKPDLVETLLPYGSSLEVYSASGIFSGLQPVLAGMLIFVFLAKPFYRGITLPSWLSLECILAPFIDSLFYWLKTSLKQFLWAADRNRQNITYDQMLVGIMMFFILLIIFYFGVLN